MPIFEIIFNKPLFIPFLYFAQFAVGLPLRSLRCVRSKIIWNASHGKTAVAPKLNRHAI